MAEETPDRMRDPAERVRDAVANGTVADFLTGIESESIDDRHIQVLTTEGYADKVASGELKELSADELRQILLGIDRQRPSRQPPHPRGLQIVGLKIVGRLDLYNLPLDCPIRLVGCFFEDDVSLEHAKTRTIDFRASILKELRLDGAHIHGNLKVAHARLHRALTARGAEFDASCIGQKIKFLGDWKTERPRLDFTLAQVRGDFTFDKAEVIGGTKFVGTSIGGSVNLQSSSFSGSTMALDARNVRIEGSFNLGGSQFGLSDSGCAASLAFGRIGGSLIFGVDQEGSKRPIIQGGIFLHKAEISGDVDLNNVSFDETRIKAFALSARNVTISGSLLAQGLSSKRPLLMNYSFVKGNVRFDKAEIELSESKAQPLRPSLVYDRRSVALQFNDLHVGRDLFLGPIATIRGVVDLMDARIEGGIFAQGTKIEGLVRKQSEDRAVGTKDVPAAIYAPRLRVGGPFNAGPYREETRKRGVDVVPFNCTGTIVFDQAEFAADLIFEQAYLCGIHAPAIMSRHAKVHGDIDMSRGFKADGGVCLRFLQLDGNFDARGGSFHSHEKIDGDEHFRMNGIALDVRRSRITGNLWLGFVARLDDEGSGDGGKALYFSAKGCVVLQGAEIGANVLLRGANIYVQESRRQNEFNYIAIHGQSLTVRGDFDCAKATDNVAFFGSDPEEGKNLQKTHVRRTSINGTIFLKQAKIGGDLNFSRMHVSRKTNEDKRTAGDTDHYAIDAMNMRIGGDVRFVRNFVATGTVRLTQTELEGNLIIYRARFNLSAAGGQEVLGKPSTDGVTSEAFLFNLGKVGLDLRIGMDPENPDDPETPELQLNVRFNGNVGLESINVRGDLLVERTIFFNPSLTKGNKGAAFWAYACRIDGNLFLRDTVRVVGDLVLTHGKVGRDLMFWYDAQLSFQHVRIMANRVIVGGVLHWNANTAWDPESVPEKDPVRPKWIWRQLSGLRRSASAIVSFLSRKIAEWSSEKEGRLQTPNESSATALLSEVQVVPIHCEIDLTESRAAQLLDHPSGWPTGNDVLKIDGFVYDNLAASSLAIDSHRRLKHFLRSPDPSPPLQPFEQLGRVLFEAGQTKSAQDIDKHRLRIKHRQYRGIAKLAYKGADLVFGYGFALTKPLAVVLLAIVGGWYSFKQAHDSGAIYMAQEEMSITGTVAEVYFNSIGDGSRAEHLAEQIPVRSCDVQGIDGYQVDGYPTFSPFMFAVDLFIPIIDFHQREYWIAGPISTRECPVVRGTYGEAAERPASGEALAESSSLAPAPTGLSDLPGPSTPVYEDISLFDQPLRWWRSSWEWVEIQLRSSWEWVQIHWYLMVYWFLIFFGWFLTSMAVVALTARVQRRFEKW